MITDLPELIRLCEDELHDREYHVHHASILVKEWAAVLQWFEQMKVVTFDHDSAISYCDEVIGSHIIVDGMSDSQKKRLRAVRMLLSYQERGDFEYRTPRVEYTFPGTTGEIILRYLQHEREKGLSVKTVETKRLALYRFNRFLIEKNLGFSDLGVTEIEDFLSLTADSSLAKRHNNANHIRQLFHYLYDFGITKKDHAIFVLEDQYRKHCKLPTIYTEDEISLMIQAVDRSSATGKRDYLVLLLASEYGWRAGDIVNFKFSQIDWNKNTISFDQSKTDVPVEFPLLASVGNATSAPTDAVTPEAVTAGEQNEASRATETPTPTVLRQGARDCSKRCAPHGNSGSRAIPPKQKPGNRNRSADDF